MIIGSLLYANEYDGTWHSSVGWMDTLTPYIKDERVFHDDHAEAEGGYGYAFRGKASRIVASMPENPSTYLLIFDSNLFGRSAYGDATSIPKEGRHDGKFVEGFMDGHAMAVLTGR